MKCTEAILRRKILCRYKYCHVGMKGFSFQVFMYWGLQDCGSCAVQLKFGLKKLVTKDNMWLV